MDLTLELIDKVAGAISCGASVTDTAGALGVGRSTLYRWLRSGKDAARLRDEGHTTYDALMLRLHEEVEKAGHEAKVEALMALRKAFRGWTEVETTTTTMPDGTIKEVRKERTRFEWQAALAYLERKHPEEFARIIRTELSGPDGGAIPLEQRAAGIADELAAWLAAGAPQE